MISEQKKTVSAIVLFLISLYFWNSLWMFPVRLLTVFFHESSHGLAAVVTGGSIQKITVNMDESGCCWTLGGNRVIILSAGYLGSLIWGGLLLIIASRTDWDRMTLFLLGLILISVSVIYVRNAGGLIFGILFGLAILVFSKTFPNDYSDIFLRYLGVCSCLYVIMDIKSDLVDNSISGSDSFQLAQKLHLPDKLVGAVWLIVALFLTYKILHFSLNKK
ncbi:MAG: M50 family metallopeptidase [Candidatus Riflebacteria bacterium]|nr:M50 family metallopeptidase [Candidatus Riflebacteria bacterium]